MHSPWTRAGCALQLRLKYTVQQSVFPRGMNEHGTCSWNSVPARKGPFQDRTFGGEPGANGKSQRGHDQCSAAQAGEHGESAGRPSGQKAEEKEFTNLVCMYMISTAKTPKKNNCPAKPTWSGVRQKTRWEYPKSRTNHHTDRACSGSIIRWMLDRASAEV